MSGQVSRGSAGEYQADEQAGVARLSWRVNIAYKYSVWGGFPVAQLVKNLPAMWETWVQSLGWEDPLEKRKATHSSVLAWRIPGMGEPGRLPSMGSHRVGHY